jgi:hypothetical protein
VRDRFTGEVTRLDRLGRPPVQAEPLPDRQFGVNGVA